MNSHHLVRVYDGFIAGVAGGLARRLGVSPTIVRLLWVVAVLFFGTGLLAYAVLWWVVPREDRVPIEPTVWRRDGRGYKPPLARTAVDRKIFGVLGGVARHWELDPSLVRLAAIGAAFASVGIVLVAYLLAAALMPSPDKDLVSRPVDL